MIVKALTLSDGLKSYLLKGILTTKKGKLKSAYFQPLTQLEIVAQHRNKGTLESIREAKVTHHYGSLYSDMAKNAMILFLAEMLANRIHEEESNEGMYGYLEASLQWLEAHGEISTFHISFLLTFTKYLGYYPGDDNHTAKSFDLLEGEFTDHTSLNPVLHGQNLD